MIFACYKYKEFHLDNKEAWPIQPPTTENWCKMVNNNNAYCKKFNWFKWIAFYFFMKVRNIRYSRLPSIHPYWRRK